MVPTQSHTQHWHCSTSPVLAPKHNVLRMFSATKSTKYAILLTSVTLTAKGLSTLQSSSVPSSQGP